MSKNTGKSILDPNQFQNLIDWFLALLYFTKFGSNPSITLRYHGD